MPIYESICKKCGTAHEYIRQASDCYNTPECCGEKTQKVILTAPVGYVHNVSYTSPIDGRPITTKQARIEDMKRNNCRPWEGLEQETKVAQQRKAEEEKKEDAKLEEAVVSALHSMPESKRRILEKAA